jgi:hypothetical protein
VTSAVAAAGLGLLGCNPVSVTNDDETIHDLTWTYGWPCPRAVYSAAEQRIFLGGNSSKGLVQVGMIDLQAHSTQTIPLVQWVPDDHDTPGMLWEADQPPLLVAADHDRLAYGLQWVGDTPLDFGNLVESQLPWDAPPSYGQLIRRPGTSTVLVVFRGGTAGNGQYVKTSTDWGTTWGPQYEFWGGPDYGTHRISADGGTMWMAAAYNPDNTTNQVEVFQADLASGAIRDATGTHTSARNLWSLTGSLEKVILTRPFPTLSPPNFLRLFDVSPNGDLLLARWQTGDTTGSYRLLRRSSTGTYTEETLCDGGVPFGYTSSWYLGGMTFDTDANHILMCRESSGTWTLERWTCTAGVWSSSILLTRSASSGHKLARPIVPVGSEGLGLTLVLDVASYSATSYTSYLTDARLVRDLTSISGSTTTSTASTTSTTAAAAPASR